MQTKEYKVTLTFTEPLLGSQPGNKEIQEEFIASKAPTIAAAKEELSASQVPEEIEKAATVFAKDETGIFLWDYQIRGSFKEAMAILIELKDIDTPSKWQVKKSVDCLLFVSPRRCYLRGPDGQILKEAHGRNQRSLRASTLQGDRIALASSDFVNPGTTLSYTVKLFQVPGNGAKESKIRIKDETIEQCVKYNGERGFGQWRSGGWGRYDYVIE